MQVASEPMGVVVTEGEAPPAGGTSSSKKVMRRLSTRALILANLALPASGAAFLLAGVLGTWLQTGRGSTSWAASTALGAAYLRAVSAFPLLQTLCFQGCALTFVLLARRLNEHKAAPPPPPPQPRSRQERRRWQAEARKALSKDRRGLEERVRAMGGRIVKVRE